jgi:hypothetical protein
MACVLASWDNCLCSTLRDRFMTAFGVVGTIAADTCNGLVGGNLVEQEWQYRRIACGVVGHFIGPDFQRSRVNAKVDPTPLATVVGPMFLVSHSPSPSILIPVLSTRKCNPVVVGCAAIVTDRCF